MAKVFMSTYVSRMNVAVISAYRKSCFLPFKLDSVNTICRDKKKPSGKLTQKEMICAPTGAVMYISAKMCVLLLLRITL